MTEKITFAANELFLKLCNRPPNDSEIVYCDTLNKSLKIPKQTSMTVSTHYRHDICQNNPSAAEFEQTYQQLTKTNFTEIDTFISLLQIIKNSPDIIELLGQTYLPSDNLQEINQSNKYIAKIGDGSRSSNSDVPSSKNTLSDSPYYTLDFVDTTTLTLSEYKAPLISSLDRASQERALIQDLIYCLMGNHGIYIQALPLKTADRSFDIDASMYPGFLDLVKSILLVCSHISTVSRFVDEYSKYEYGNVNQALASAINTQIKDFRLLVCQMEELFLNGNLTLTAMLNYIGEPGNLMRCMADMCQDIIKFKSRGGAVLSMFSQHGLSAGSPKLKALVNHLMQCATVPFFRILKIWIFRGIISDQYKEFFIQDNNDQKGKPNDTKIGPKYWSSNYTVIPNLIPKFLVMHVEKILNTGKYLNVIQLCGGDADFPVIEDMAYENEEQHYVLQIDQAYQHASKLLLNIMFNDKKLKDHLQVMKHYFLLDQADWLSHFMYSANDELNEKINDCQLERLESLLDVAIQIGGTANDSLKQNITIDLSKQELIPFIYHIMKYDVHKKSSAKKEVVGQNLRVLEAFSLKINTEWPISLVLNSSVVQKYQIIFRYLFYCHHVERVLLGVWSSNKCSSTGHLANFHLINKASILGNKMRTFIQHLIYYMTTEVIEPFWITFKTKLDQAQNLDEVLLLHEHFLESCTINCVGSAEMLLHLQKMMVLCVNYSDRFNRLSSRSHAKNEDSFNKQTDTEDISRMYNSKSFEQFINTDEATFTSIAKDFIGAIRNEKDNKMLLKLVDRLEFNGFYGAGPEYGSDVDR